MDSLVLKNNPISISNEDPFKEDLLDRKISVDLFKNFLSKISSSFIICIDSPWGTGKTTFIQLLKQVLEDNKFSTFYYDAWENDFTDNPLLSLMGEIDIFLEKNNSKSSKNISKLRVALKSSAINLAKKSMPAIVNIASHGLVNNETISNLFEVLTENTIDEYTKSKSEISTFKSKLTEGINELKRNGKPVVFFIDELDRCKPIFAIELLEKLKHLFSVENLIFIISMDKKQIGYSLKTIYGNELDIDGYLRRFFDFTYILPTCDNERFIDNLFNKLNLRTILKEMKNKGSNDDYDTLLRLLNKMFNLLNSSLRVQEQIITKLSFILLTIPPNFYLYSYTLAVFLVLSEMDFYYNDYLNGIINGEQLYEKFIERKLKSSANLSNSQLDDETIETFLEAILIYFDTTEVKEKLNKYEKLRLNCADNSKEYYRYLGILDNLKFLHSVDSHKSMKQITIKRIYFAEGFII